MPTRREQLRPAGFGASGTSSSFLPSPEPSIAAEPKHRRCLDPSRGGCSTPSVCFSLCDNLKVSCAYGPFTGEESALRIPEVAQYEA